LVGFLVGLLVGVFVGCFVGCTVGADVGGLVGAVVGASDGLLVGARVGASVVHTLHCSVCHLPKSTTVFWVMTPDEPSFVKHVNRSALYDSLCSIGTQKKSVKCICLNLSAYSGRTHGF
jgi:uncharacterized protein YcfJ